MGTLLPRRRIANPSFRCFDGPHLRAGGVLATFDQISMPDSAVPCPGVDGEKERRVADRLADPDPLGREADEVRRDGQDGKQHVTPPELRVLGTRPLSARRLLLAGRD
jgi:hypothetical protein